MRRFLRYKLHALGSRLLTLRAVTLVAPQEEQNPESHDREPLQTHPVLTSVGLQHGAAAVALEGLLRLATQVDLYAAIGEKLLPIGYFKS